METQHHKKEVLEAIVKGEQTVNEVGITQFNYGELIVIVNVDEVNEVAEVITVRYSRKKENKARKEVKRSGIYVREAYGFLKEQSSAQFDESIQ